MSELNQMQQMVMALRAQIGYGDAVRRWETRFFQLVAVQFRDGYWQLEHRGRKRAGALALEHAVDEKGELLKFGFVIPNCYLEASPVKDLLRLVIPPEKDGDPAQTIDFPPEAILYVTGLSPFAAGEDGREKPRIYTMSS